MVEELDNREDKQEEKQEKKEETKKTLKTIVASVLCTLLFTVILLLLVLLGLKKCGRVSDLDSSSSEPNSSEYVEIYDNKKLNSVFKRIVYEQAHIDLGEQLDIKDVIAVTYIDNYPSKFDLSITASTDNEVLFYNITSCVYQNDVTGYDNLVSYLLKQDQNSDWIYMSDSEEEDTTFSVGVERENKNTAEVLNISKSTSYFMASTSLSSKKHISGYYYQDSKFCVYNRVEYTDSGNPLGSNEGTLIDESSLLYGYYLRLSGVITD